MKKLYNYRFTILSAVFAAFMMVGFVSCEDDETSGPWDTNALDALIVEAESLIASSEEGGNPGDFKPGAIKELQECVDWCKWKINNSDSQDDIVDATNKLQIYINKFKTNTVALAIPWIKQNSDTYIQISDNIKSVLDGAWTIEIECYIIDLNKLDYSSYLFSCEQSGPDSGFGVRYFPDGNIQTVVGNNNWVDTGNQAGAGTMKVGQWMHVALSNDGSHQVMYVDGVEVATNDNTHMLSADKPFVIGNSPMWTSRACNAMLRDLRVWNGVRSAQQIADNKDADMKGDEEGLEMYFPLVTDLGDSFSDVSGKYTAKLIGDIQWQLDGTPPEISLDYTALNESIAELEAFRGTITEGTNDGDYPAGTIAYINELIAEGNSTKENASRQDEIDGKASQLSSKIETINKMLVSDAVGIFVDREDKDAVGLRITPNYTPQGDYTVEFDVKVRSLFGYGTGEFFNNGEYGVWVYGYQELTEENVLASGGLWNFTNAGNGWQGPKTDPLVMKTGEWQHVALVHDNTARTTKIFVDGVEEAVFEDIGAPNVSGWGEMWLGNGWGKMDGYIKDFRLWDVARDAADLDAEITGTEPGLNAYFPLDKVAGVKFEDVTGNYKGEMRGISWNK
ncbi:hypothetical protein KEM09_05005 [Carboxylicivirga mesophila]|uniref:LamG-like jellyroll fold domain-containing protein n=1 Tax=Carboxylicivirga mesophila TaxID=1166478 RepID=A0ABS5K706_9BACT|nr:LamG domain-containing protein [Carboxylicivirga mesophila]MBS2210745.1 hypothetical protein [Carboxylicivirga mesophila]